METCHGNHLDACQVLQLLPAPQYLNIWYPEDPKYFFLPLILFSSPRGNLSSISVFKRHQSMCVSTRRIKTNSVALLNVPQILTVSGND